MINKIPIYLFRAGEVDEKEFKGMVIRFSKALKKLTKRKKDYLLILMISDDDLSRFKDIRLKVYGDFEKYKEHAKKINLKDKERRAKRRKRK